MLKVLVADDNIINLRVASRVLKDLGCSGFLAKDGVECLKIWSAEKIDLLLLDATMPNKDGMQVLTEIREKESRLHLRGIPIAMLTSFDLPSDKIKYINAGANFYIIKPLTKEALIPIFEKLLNRQYSLNR